MLARKPDRSYDCSAIRDMLGDHAKAASLIEWAAGVALVDLSRNVKHQRVTLPSRTLASDQRRSWDRYASRVHPVTATVVLIEHEGRVLGVARREDPNAFGLPGGKIDKKETARAAALRELREETGVEVGLDDLRLVYVGPARKGTFDDSWVAAFRAPLPAGVEPRTPPGEGRVAWVAWGDLLSGPFGEYNRELEAAIAREQPPVTTWAMFATPRESRDRVIWWAVYRHESQVELHMGRRAQVEPVRVTLDPCGAYAAWLSTSPEERWPQWIYPADADGGSVSIEMCFGSRTTLLRAVDLGEGRLVRLRIDPEPKLGGA